MKSEERSVIVHPAFALEWRDISDFYGEFGPYNGRYVPRYPKDWIEQYLKHLNDLPTLKPVERNSFLEFKKGIRHLTTQGRDSWDDCSEWEANANAFKETKPGTLVIGNGSAPEPFIGWPKGVIEIRSSRRRTWEFHGNISNYLSYVKPLLENAPAAYLIDPYLDPLASATEYFLSSIFNQIKGSRCYKVHIITEQKACCAKKAKERKIQCLPEDEIASDLKRIYASRVGRERQLLVHLVGPGRQGDHLRMHERYFLTNFGAIRFGKGFAFSHRNPNTATIVDKEEHLSVKHQYIDGVTRHKEQLPRRANIPYPSSVSTLIVAGE